MREVSVSRLLNNALGKWSIYDIAGVAGAWIACALSSSPVHDWFEKTIICTGSNPFSPLNPAIVNGLLKSSLGIFFIVIFVLILIHKKKLTNQGKLGIALVCLASMILTGLQYSSGYRKIERVTATDADTVRFNQWWCERRSEKG